MKRKVISCVLAGASVFSLVCINGGNLLAKADGDVTEIRFTEWDGGDTLAVYEEIAEKFNESHPDIHVTVMNVPDEYDTKITAMIAGNDIPEVCMMNSDTLLFPLAEQGIVANLEYIDKDRASIPSAWAISSNTC